MQLKDTQQDTSVKSINTLHCSYSIKVTTITIKLTKSHSAFCSSRVFSLKQENILRTFTIIVSSLEISEVEPNVMMQYDDVTGRTGTGIRTGLG